MPGKNIKYKCYHCGKAACINLFDKELNRCITICNTCYLNKYRGANYTWLQVPNNEIKETNKMNKISGKSINGYKIDAIFYATENGLELNSFEVEPTEEIKEKIYREKELKYRILDAKRHIENYIYSNEIISVDEIKELRKESTAIFVAKSFLENYDCNRSENDQWGSIISNCYNAVIRKWGIE